MKCVVWSHNQAGWISLLLSTRFHWSCYHFQWKWSISHWLIGKRIRLTLISTLITRNHWHQLTMESWLSCIVLLVHCTQEAWSKIKVGQLHTWCHCFTGQATVQTRFVFVCKHILLMPLSCSIVLLHCKDERNHLEIKVHGRSLIRNLFVSTVCKSLQNTVNWRMQMLSPATEAWA